MLRDGNGYEPTPQHLTFLGLTEEDLSDCESRTCPLGMNLKQFDIFFNSLNEALERDRISECDIRLQGSSAHFYSGYHKTMPWDRDAIYQWFRTQRERLPEQDELDEIESRINSVWPTGQLRPLRRPFDSMFRIGVDRYPSDYDIQISSDEIAERAQEHIGSLNISVSDFTMLSGDYDFIHKEIIDVICPTLTRWALLQTDRLLRKVTVAVFSSAGPPNKEKDPNVGKKSSHFRPTDWILN
jgi:hypothetical protein